MIDIQTKLTETRCTERRAITVYNKAFADVKFAEGSFLESFDFQVAELKREPDPWWARV